MKKKLTAFFLAALMMAGMLTGCGVTDSDNNAPPKRQWQQRGHCRRCLFLQLPHGLFHAVTRPVPDVHADGNRSKSRSRRH